VYLPVLFGTPGRAASGGYIAKSMAKGCVSKEFAAFATGKTEPLSIWLRALARHAHAEFCGEASLGLIELADIIGRQVAALHVRLAGEGVEHNGAAAR
jgi:hypothetical protein